MAWEYYSPINSTGLIGIIQGINIATSGYLTIGILAAVFLVTFITTFYRSPKFALATAGAMTTFFAVLWRSVVPFPDTYILLSVGLMVLGFIVYILLPKNTYEG